MPILIQTLEDRLALRMGQLLLENEDLKHRLDLLVNVETDAPQAEATKDSVTS